jgi:hypothetical protein
MVYAPSEPSALALVDATLSRREELIVPQLPPDITATVLALDHQGLPAAELPPRVILLDAFLASKEPSPGEADELPLEPFTPRVGEVPCPVVSCRLHDPAERVADRAWCPLNEQTAWPLHTCRASDVRTVPEPGPDLWLGTSVVARALVEVCIG